MSILSYNEESRASIQQKGQDMYRELDDGLVSKVESDMNWLMRQMPGSNSVSIAAESHQEQLPSWELTHSFFAEKVRHVEICQPNGELAQVYFPVLPTCNKLSVDEQRRIVSSLRRSSAETKVESFFKETTHAILEVSYRQWLAQRVSWWSRLHNNGRWSASYLWRDFSMLLTLAINFVVLFSLDRRGLTLGNLSEDNTHTLLWVLMGLHLAVSTGNTAYYLLHKGPLLVYANYKEAGLLPGDHSVLDSSKLVLGVSRVAKTCNGFCVALRSIVSDPIMLYFLVTWALTMVAVFTFNPELFVVHLLGIFVKFRGLSAVLESIVRPRKTLALTALLYIVLVYMFALTGFKLFENDYPDDECENLLLCMRFTFDAGFKNDGGIGSGMLQPTGEELYNVSHVTGRLIYDNLFNILMLVLLLNIIFGITIDTFAELRAEKEQQKEDQFNSCTICSIDRVEFDRNTENGFKYHIHYEHNMWDYIFFIVYLINKEPTEYTGVESYVVECISQGSVAFFPVGKAMALNDGAGPEEEVEDTSQDSHKLLQALGVRMESLEATMSKVVMVLSSLEASSHQSSRPSSPTHDLRLSR
eukprot:TRINITY_DN12291_c0_g2_i1.p1 TRINITY_DN12291_c0_g2~~TRINITY_DN12291_c0_g2_i1.p1  ORF type:complete len:586 (-),score=129.96 TRINITY_DN12291_c0_g2_i1:222-1979(-)